MLIPVGLEDRALRRIPWATLIFLLANVVAFIVSAAVGTRVGSQVEILESLLEGSLAARPYLALNDGVAAALGKERADHLAGERALWEARHEVPSAERLKMEQRELDQLAQEYLSALDRLPWRRFGFIPARPDPTNALTAMFMHGGWLHLLGNMLFLYLCGSCLEDVYGPTLYAGSYVLLGLAATLGHYLASPSDSVPLVGASGAIAGLMGMTLVRLGRTKVRFLFLPILFLPNLRVPLTLPALVVLPFWFLEQLYFAGRTSGEGSGVAWWAHIAGFGAGSALAASVLLLGIEERATGRTEEVDEGRRALDRAALAREAGDHETARQQLRRALTAEPGSAEAWSEAYALALETGDGPELARAMMRLLELLPARGEAATARSLVEEGGWAQVPGLPPRLLLSVAAFLEKDGDAKGALAYYDEAIAAAPTDVLSLRALVRKGEMLMKGGDYEAAQRALDRAREHPALSEEWRATVDRVLAARPQSRPPRGG